MAHLNGGVIARPSYLRSTKNFSTSAGTTHASRNSRSSGRNFFGPRTGGSVEAGPREFNPKVAKGGMAASAAIGLLNALGCVENTDVFGSAASPSDEHFCISATARDVLWSVNDSDASAATLTFATCSSCIASLSRGDGSGESSRLPAVLFLVDATVLNCWEFSNEKFWAGSANTDALRRAKTLEGTDAPH
jgi:hypothetical protein